jgi:hypothetical protein
MCLDRNLVSPYDTCKRGYPARETIVVRVKEEYRKRMDICNESHKGMEHGLIRKESRLMLEVVRQSNRRPGDRIPKVPKGK